MAGMRGRVRRVNRFFVSVAFWSTLSVTLVVCASAPLFLTVFQATEPAAEATRIFLGRTTSGELDQAYALLAPGYREAVSPASFRVLVEKNPGLFQVQGASFLSRHVLHDGRVQLRGNLVNASGEARNCLFELEPVAGAWRITHFQISVEPIPE